ncbi:MAG: hypothetical protein KGJ13_04850 [Patescibacteria group bacterium]|nr:hypothetical protein [Patescibacteria group bacterium]
MNFGKLAIGLLVLILAFLLQAWVPIAGLRGDFVLAALIAFAFIFPFWELLLFILLAVFTLNWQPHLGFELAAFAAVPIAAFVLRLWLSWEKWIGIAVSTVGGIFIFYALITPRAIFPNLANLLLDAAICAVFAEVVVWGAE